MTSSVFANFIDNMDEGLLNSLQQDGKFRTKGRQTKDISLPYSPKLSMVFLEMVFF